MTYHIIISLRSERVKNLVCAAEEKYAQMGDITGQQTSHTLNPSSHSDNQGWCSSPLVQTYVQWPKSLPVFLGKSQPEPYP